MIHPIEDIINSYLNKSATEEEKNYLLQWLDEKEENKIQFRETYDLWLQANAALIDDAEMESAWNRFEKRTKIQKGSSQPLSLSRFSFLRIAASILLLLAVGYAGYLLGSREEEPVIVYNHLLTGADGKGEYTLPDGSTVWLNANSVLKYPEVFTGEKRTVQLEGEALFEVKKDKKRPFYVEVEGMDIEVTGTRFLARNYPEKNQVEAVLVNGSVKVSGEYFPETQTLHPGELLIYDKQSGQIERQQVDTDNYTNWIHAKLVFDRTNLADVIINLEKWFGIEIMASPELTRNIHMSFTIRRESLEEVLSYMTLTSPIAYEWKGEVLHLKNK
ncbi:transmembrane sensor [Parabacteroides sp. PFB2-12]|uniref:FecR family protein n=1 Tax=unclassified Parabacteroides TaxID=2649774 RepID=UPI0024731670|nr:MULTISPECIES: FecR family protein [unclassified Parabacteroides]MDH6342580.1 transmembrane sensor [Parabacteroides sp. PM6-13]MDH6390232.1 transmembrane sensor [Parabacteroides sp. PFB2-12]